MKNKYIKNDLSKLEEFVEDKHFEFLLKGNSSLGAINFLFVHSFENKKRVLRDNIGDIINNIANVLKNNTGISQKTKVSFFQFPKGSVDNFYACVNDPIPTYGYLGNAATIAIFLKHSSSLNSAPISKDISEINTLAGHEVVHTFFKYPSVKTRLESHNEEHMCDTGSSIMFGAEGLISRFSKKTDVTQDMEDSETHPAPFYRRHFLSQGAESPYHEPATKMIEEISKRAANGQITSLVNSLKDMRPEDFANGRF